MTRPESPRRSSAVESRRSAGSAATAPADEIVKGALPVLTCKDAFTCAMVSGELSSHRRKMPHTLAGQN